MRHRIIEGEIARDQYFVRSLNSLLVFSTLARLTFRLDSTGNTVLCHYFKDVVNLYKARAKVSNLSYNKSVKFLYISILSHYSFSTIHVFSDTFFMIKKYPNLSASGGNSRKLKGDSPFGRPVILRVSCSVPALP